MQPGGERVGAREQLRVGQFGVAVAHGHTVAAAGGAGGQPLPQRPRRGRLGAGGGDQRGAFPLGEQVDVADPHGRVGDGGPQDRDVPVGERGDGARVVQVGGVGEFEVDAGAGLGDDELDVEVGVLVGHRQHPRGQAGQLERVDGGAAQRQGDLEQRMPGGVAGGIEAFDEGLERRVGVGVGGEVAGVDLGEQVGEGGVRVDGGAQDEGPGEHADEGVELRVAAPGDDGADGDVVAGAVPGQQHGQRRVQHHERRRATVPGEPRNTCGHRMIHRHPVGGTAAGRARGPRPVAGQGHLVGQAGEHGRPVRELAVGAGALPAAEVGVLHRQRRPPRRLPGAPGGVGVDEVAQQRGERPFVGGDVVHHHREHVPPRREPVQPHPHRRLAGEIEAGGGELADELVEPLGGHGDGLEAGPRDGPHHLRGGVGVHGAQGAVPVEDVGDGGGERRDVEPAVEPHRERQVVAAGSGVEPVDEPQPLLRRRQRRRGVVAGRDERGTATAGAGAGGEQRGEVGDGGGVEHVADGDVDVGDVGEAPGEAGREQRVAAEVEEVVAGADGPGAEQFPEHLGDEFLERPVRGEAAGGGDGGCGQGRAVELAVGGARQRIQGDGGGGHEVVGQGAAQRAQRPGG
ncbi:hypothetical protein RAJCM14343_1524 [Rhodococcus aetherivorans]|uniref:Uncharacterized protein n=1 Tax=Rhodococcus aetherivorans TaxID=191292 RepID=A0ABQ0YI94_9NOCA|nr:hypothetical protein RAJCM14343_1524 [Rhodococcus aetherivorans]